jgi:hypothetical protein
MCIFAHGYTHIIQYGVLLSTKYTYTENQIDTKIKSTIHSSSLSIKQKFHKTLDMRYNLKFGLKIKGKN